METVVCYKWVKDEEDLRINPDLTVDLSRAKRKISNYDRNAIKAARLFAEAAGSEAVGLTLGYEDAKASLKEALARGLQQAFWVNDKIAVSMKRKQGISPRVLNDGLKEVVAPPCYSARKSQERLDEAIGKVGMIREQFFDVSPAEDWHMLGLCHDLRNMTQCADIYFNASLSREESRGWHNREGYSEQNDNYWLNWVNVQQKDGKMVMSTEDVPNRKIQEQTKILVKLDKFKNTKASI